MYILPIKPIHDRAAGEPTAYEVEAKRLGLTTEEAQFASPALRQWVKTRHRTCYVPEEMLDAMGIKDREWGLPADTGVDRQSRRRKSLDEW